MAVHQRFLRNIPGALAALERLQRHHPAFSLLHQERGHCFVALRNAGRAIDAFLKAVNINPALPASWSMLERLFRMTRDTENAEKAAAHVETLKRLPFEVVRATALFADGDLAPAENLVRAYLIEHGHHIEAMRLLARIALKHDVLDEAELLLQTVLELEPGYRAARYDYALALLERHKYLEARTELEKLLSLEPGNLDYRTTYATTSVGLGEHERGVALYSELLIELPHRADLHLSMAHCFKALGRRDEAIDAYRAAARIKPDFGDAYWSLANLKTYGFDDDEIERMRGAEVQPGTALVDRYHLCFALGKAFENRGDFERSFRFYDRGNTLKREESRYRPEYVERNARLQMEICTRPFFEARQSVGSERTDPIFIVGLPRSGSTLLEQILASHSEVEGTQELADIPRMVLELQGREPDMSNPRYPAVLNDLDRAQFRRMGEKYLQDTAVYRTGKPHFIDKMPNNFRHIGLIHLMFPNATIIDARRHPMACCFSNLKQLFASGQEFTYSAEDIARYYASYVALMEHWDTALPGRVLRVEHESVVEDLEGNVRRLLDFCQLEYEPMCVEFYKTERSIRTASSEQVRQPIFRDGLEQWKNYAPWLGPLRDALREAGERNGLSMASLGLEPE